MGQQTPQEMFDLTALTLAAKQETFSIHRPAYSEDGYWSKPICATEFLQVPNDGQWHDLVNVQRYDLYVMVIREYIATTKDPAVMDTMEFRFIGGYQGGYVNPNIFIEPDANLHYNGFNNTPEPSGSTAWDFMDTFQYPLTRQRLEVVINQLDRLVLQVKNNGANNAVAVGGMFGWHYYDPYDVGEIGKTEGVRNG